MIDPIIYHFLTHILSFVPYQPDHQFPNSSPAPAPICAIARDLAHLAFEEGCKYFALLGDDLEITPKRTWMADVIKEFDRIGGEITPGFGCVALNDRSFKGFPTFPIVHRTHMQIFGQQIFPDVFVNQDAVSDSYAPLTN